MFKRLLWFVLQYWPLDDLLTSSIFFTGSMLCILKIDFSSLSSSPLSFKLSFNLYVSTTSATCDKNLGERYYELIANRWSRMMTLLSEHKHLLQNSFHLNEQAHIASLRNQNTLNWPHKFKCFHLKTWFVVFKRFFSPDTCWEFLMFMRLS